jgi:hypothetical protein
MADFPTGLRHTANSRRTTDAGLSVDYAADGVIRSRTLYTAPRWMFRLELLVDQTELASVYSHFTANLGSAFAYTWPQDDSTYSVQYSSYPSDIPQGDGTWSFMTVEIEGAAT